MSASWSAAATAAPQEPAHSTKSKVSGLPFSRARARACVRRVVHRNPSPSRKAKRACLALPSALPAIPPSRSPEIASLSRGQQPALFSLFTFARLCYMLYMRHRIACGGARARTESPLLSSMYRLFPSVLLSLGLSLSRSLVRSLFNALPPPAALDSTP